MLETNAEGHAKGYRETGKERLLIHVCLHFCAFVNVQDKSGTSSLDPEQTVRFQ